MKNFSHLICSCILVVIVQSSPGQVPPTISYQGRIQVSGTNFSGTGQFKFAIVSRGTNLNRQATATATVTSGFVTGIAVTDGGAGYVAPPAVTIIDSTGSGATATASVSGGAVTSITVQNAGSGYTGPTVSIAGPAPNFVYATYWSNDGTSTAGSQPSSAVIASAQEGLVNVLLGDSSLANMTAIPASVFSSPDVYLRIWFNDGVQGFAQLTPDQPLASVGYAMTAANVPASAIGSQSIVSDKLAPNVVTSAKIADGTITAADVNASSLGTLFWKLDGNNGTTAGANFVGTTDNQALELKVNGARALRLEPGAAINVIGGGPNNAASPGVVGSTIGGGTVQSITANYNTIGGGQSNAVTELYGTVGGGSMNRAGGGMASTVAGGLFNNAGGPYTTIGGGRFNTALGFVAGVTGGQGNVIETNADHSVISGGLNNMVARSTFRGVIAGGGGNVIGTDSDYSIIGGGQNNAVAGTCAFSTIGGGQNNDIGTNADFSIVAGGVFNSIEWRSFYSTIGGGQNNTIGTNSSTCTVAGGFNNDIAANSPSSTIGGGNNNNIAANATYSVIAGGTINNVGTNSDSSVIGGGNDNSIAAFVSYGTISGGTLNDIGANADRAVIGGGYENNIGGGAIASTIAGGHLNDIGINARDSVIGGGINNNIASDAASGTISGGSQNDIGSGSAYATIAGGVENNIGASSLYSSIVGGQNNNVTNSATHATIPGGDSNTATTRAFAAGTRAKAIHSGAFVWGDGSAADIASTNANSLTMRAVGGYRLFSSIAPTAGVYLAPGGGGWVALSDRNAKDNFEAVDSRAVLDKVAALPVTTWNYKSQTQAVRHIGPVAQDFKAAFGVGETETGINTVDADGIALAAIQGLNKKLEEHLKARDVEIQELKRAIAELRERVK